jgi:DNA-binding beta-propeller fold protein YncE
VLVDPDGKVVYVLTGEGKYELLDKFIGVIVKIFDQKKKINREKVIGKAERLAPGALQFPAKIIADPATQRLFIADTSNNRILISDPEGNVSDVIGSGEVGQTDGDYASAQFYMPHGMALKGDTLYVADCENHTIRAVDLKAKKVSTAAGTGQQGRKDSGPAKTTALNSPWDVLVSADGKTLYIAMAGDHRIWSMDLEKNTVGVLAGNGRENITDGAFENSEFAQPSGLALHDDVLYVADSEGSAIRALDLKTKTSSTVIGFPGTRGALFTFGDVDGKIGTAKLQHNLANIWHEGKLLIADTYNHKIKVVDPKTKTSTTLFGDGKPGKEDGKNARFNEPGGLAVLGDKLYIADSNNHLIRAADLKTKEVKTLQIKLPAKK